MSLKCTQLARSQPAVACSDPLLRNARQPLNLQRCLGHCGDGESSPGDYANDLIAFYERGQHIATPKTTESLRCSVCSVQVGAAQPCQVSLQMCGVHATLADALSAKGHSAEAQESADAATSCLRAMASGACHEHVQSLVESRSHASTAAAHEPSNSVKQPLHTDTAIL